MPLTGGPPIVMYRISKRSLQRSQQRPKLGNTVLRRTRLEGSTNRSRMTNVPGFLAGGVRSKIARKDTGDFERKILTEDLQGLLYRADSDSSDEPVKVSRLARKHLQNPNSSRSIFRDIRSRVTEHSPDKINRNFNEDLLKQTNLNLTATVLHQLGLKIYHENSRINRILSGKEEPVNEMSSIIPKVANNKSDNTQFVPVPPNEWIFKTPPRQRITTHKVNDCQIQPALLCTSKKQQNIYQLKDKINVDFSKMYNRQEISVDERYMKHVACFQTDQVDLNFTETTDNQGETTVWGKLIEPETCQEINDYFNSLTCRPKKTVVRKVRTGQLKKKNIFGGESSDNSTDDVMDYTVIREDDGELNLVSTQQETKRFKLNFETTPPDCQPPKLFDFSNIN